MMAIVHMGKVYARTLRHFFVPVRWKHYFPFFSLAALGVALLLFEYSGFKWIFDYMYTLKDLPFSIAQVLLGRLFGLIFLISYSMIFMSSMINGLSTFYLSANLPFLHTLPIRRSQILAIKFVENWTNSCYLMFFFLSVFFLSYAHSFHLGWSQRAIGLLVVVLFTVPPVAMGSAMVTLLIRFFPVRRIHQVVTLMAGIFLGALVIAVRMMKPERLLHPTNTDDFQQLIKDLTIPSAHHLPSTWASDAIIYGNHAPLWLLAALTAGSLMIMALVLKTFYPKAFIFSQESRSLRSTRTRKKRRERTPGILRSLVRKDLILFLRDATQWSQLLLLSALIVVYLINIKNLAVQLPMVRWVVSFINLGLAGFVLSALSVRFLFPSVSIEGRAFWVVKTMPVSLRTLLWSKFLIYFPPFLLFTEMLVFFSNRILQVPPFFMVLSMVNIFAVSFALTGLAIGIGALLPNFKSDNPAQIAVGPGGVLYMLLSFVYISVMLAIQIRPVWYWVIQHSDRIHNAVYGVSALLLTLLVALVPMEWGARHLSAQEYS